MRTTGRKYRIPFVSLAVIAAWFISTNSVSHGGGLNSEASVLTALRGGLVNVMQSQDRYDSLFQFYADGHLDWLLLKAQVRAESNFNPEAISHVGAKGLTQFMPLTWAEIGHGDPTNPEEAIKAQVHYLREQIQRFGDVKLALAAYNCGPGRVRGLLAKHGPRFENIEPRLPKETRDYVAKIYDFWQDYQA